MKCPIFLRQIHEFLDGELEPREASAMDEHRLACGTCRREWEDFMLLRGVLSERETLPAAVIPRMRSSITRSESLRTQARELAGHVRTWWRDLDRRLVWSKVSAVPLTLAFFGLMLVHFSPAQLEGIEMLAFSPPTSEQRSVPFIRSVLMRQHSGDLEILMEVAWRLPHEDSLSVVAEIKPDGYARIDSVLEYPRSYALYNAVNGTLRRSRFDRIRELESPVVIFSFQKIDVYEEPGPPHPAGI